MEKTVQMKLGSQILMASNQTHAKESVDESFYSIAMFKVWYIPDYFILVNKNRLNTLFLSQRIPFPPNKGEKIRTFHQIKFLRNNNHRIFLCSPYISEDELIHFKHFTQQYGVQTNWCKLGHKYLRYLSLLDFLWF